MVTVECGRSGLGTVTDRALEIWRAVDDPKLAQIGFSANSVMTERAAVDIDPRGY
jgi:hypothetical protein